MADPAKRKLSAKQILADIRSGMDAPALKQKHGLSDNSFEYVVRQLSAKGLLTREEIKRFEPSGGSSGPSRKPAVSMQWRCPQCNAPQPAQVAECPACGVVVAKFVERQEEKEHAAKIAPRFTRDAEPGGGKGWASIIVSIVVFALIGGTVLVWSAHRANEKSKIVAVDLTTQPAEEGESEAVHSHENVDDLAGVGREYTELPVEDDQAKTPSLEPMAALQHAPHVPEAEPPREVPAPAPAAPKYVTGVLRQFGSGNFQKEVVDASKTYPVLVQFYSNT